MKAIMQLENYSVENVKFTINKDSYYANINDKDSTDAYDFGFEIFKSADGDKFLVEFNMSCNEAEENAGSPYSFSLTINGIFGFEKDVSKEAMEKMVGLNCVSILYGLARGIIAQISAHTPKGKIILPTVNFVEYFKNKLNENAAPQKPAKTAVKKSAKRSKKT